LYSGGSLYSGETGKRRREERRETKEASREENEPGPRLNRCSLDPLNSFMK
jgi:hypothetical protein